MHMRAHFGTIGLLEWKRNKDSYTLTELKTFLHGLGRAELLSLETLLAVHLFRCFGVHLNPSRIGNVAIVDELRRRLADLTAIAPYDMNVVSFYEIEPSYSIILITKTSTSNW